MNAKERLIEFIKVVKESADPNISQFEKEIGLSNAYVQSIRQSIGPGALKKIKEKYPQLNEIWLLHGQGEMLLGQPINPQDSEKPKMKIDTPGNQEDSLSDGTANILAQMIAVNKIYAEAHKTFADSHFTFAQAHDKAMDNNVNLTELAKGKSLTDIELKDTLSDVVAKLRVLQELSLKLGVGTLWKSEEEGRTQLHRLVSDAVMGVQEVDTHVDSDKQHS